MLSLFLLILVDQLAAASKPGSHLLAIDPSRVLQAVVGGIGFLGAGVILRSGENVKGVATAASIWVTGGIGVACGCGYYFLSVSLTAMAFIVLTALRIVEVRAMGEENKTEDSEKKNGDEG